MSDKSIHTEVTFEAAFAECKFIDKHENILITGSTGIGKSYFASAIGHHACQLGHKVVYYNTANPTHKAL